MSEPTTSPPRIRATLGYYVQNPNFAIGLGLVGLVVITALVSPVYTPFDPVEQTITNRLEAPSATHPFGTDWYGRDLLSRVMLGAVNSIKVGLISVGIGLGFGVVIGMLAGFHGRWLDEIAMRAMDVLYGFPAVLSALLITSILGPGITNSIIAIGIFNIPIFARLTRGNFLSLKEQDFVNGARAIGRDSWGIIARHILPNALSPIIVQATISFAVAILAEAGLSYLGLGTQPPNPSWGLMLRNAQQYMSHSIWPAIFPGLGIAVAVLGFNLIGDGLRDILDPQLRNIR